MAIQDSINQMLGTAGAMAIGMEHLENQRAEQVLKGTEMQNRLDEKIEAQQNEIDKVEKDPKYINSKKEIENIGNDLNAIGELNTQAQDLVKQGIMDVNPLEMNEYVQKAGIAQKHLRDKLEAQKMIAEEYKSRVDGLKRSQARLMNEREAYQPFIDRANRLRGLK